MRGYDPTLGIALQIIALWKGRRMESQPGANEQFDYDDYDDDDGPCPTCNGDGGDRWNDYCTPCPTCHGEG